MNQFIPGVALEINRAQPCSNGIACTTGWSADQTFNRRINFRSIGLRVRAKAAFSSSPLSLSLVSLPTVVRAQSHEGDRGDDFLSPPRFGTPANNEKTNAGAIKPR